jgi:hypothetical protein
MSLLGNTVLLATNSARAVGTMAIAILVLVTRGNGLAPVCAALKVDVLDIGAGVNDVDIYTLTTIGSVQVLVVGAKRQARSVRNAGQTPRSILFDLGLVIVRAEGVNNRVLLDELNLEKWSVTLVPRQPRHVQLIAATGAVLTSGFLRISSMVASSKWPE